MESPEAQRASAPSFAEGASFQWLNLCIYVGIAVGYFSTIFTASRFNVGGFLLVTGASAAWTLIYVLIATGHIEMRSRWLIVLAALSCTAVLASLIDMGLDWFLPVLTVGFICAIFPLRIALPIGVAFWIFVGVITTMSEGRLDTWNLLQLAAPFAFTIVFAYSMNRVESANAHARRLLATLEHSNAELEAAHAQLQAYATQVEELSATRERNRIAREIHDTLGHSLTLLAVQLETATRLEERGDPGLHEELLEARRVAKECLTEVRHSVAALRPDAASSGSFEEALRRLVAEFETTCREPAVTLDLDEATAPLSPEQRMALYRCAQEALTNIRKHARATKALLRLSTDDGVAELTVLDNGQGAAAQSNGPTSGFGLLGMRERVALLDGTLKAGPEPEHGWRVEVIIPLQQREKAGVSTPAAGEVRSEAE